MQQPSLTDCLHISHCANCQTTLDSSHTPSTNPQLGSPIMTQPAPLRSQRPRQTKKENAESFVRISLFLADTCQTILRPHSLSALADSASTRRSSSEGASFNAGGYMIRHRWTVPASTGTTLCGTTSFCSASACNYCRFVSFTWSNARTGRRAVQYFCLSFDCFAVAPYNRRMSRGTPDAMSCSEAPLAGETKRQPRLEPYKAVTCVRHGRQGRIPKLLVVERHNLSQLLDISELEKPLV